MYAWVGRVCGLSAFGRNCKDSTMSLSMHTYIALDIPIHILK